jgi:hypothetical protein
MAEIRIERKRRGLGLLWLFLALVIVAVLAWYFLYPGGTTTAPASAPPTGSLKRGEPETHGAGIGLLAVAGRRRPEGAGPTHAPAAPGAHEGARGGLVDGGRVPAEGGQVAGAGRAVRDRMQSAIGGWYGEQG